jgi:hypothetical protein
MTMPEEKTTDLVRGLGLWQATALNIANTTGVGPFSLMLLAGSAVVVSGCLAYAVRRRFRRA